MGVGSSFTDSLFLSSLPLAWVSDTPAGKRTELWVIHMGLFNPAPTYTFLGCFSTEDTSPPQCSCCILGGTCSPAPCWHQQDKSSQSPYRNGASRVFLPLLGLRAGVIRSSFYWPGLPDNRTHRTPKALWLLNGALSGSWRRSSWQNA